jgi:transposase-like protein
MVTLLTNIFFGLVECLLSHQLNTEKTSHPTAALPPCPSCGSHHTIKNGSTHNGKPKRQCKECGQPFVINPTNKTISPDTKKLIDKLLLERISLRGIARVTGVSWSWLQNYVNNKLAAVPRQVKVSEKSLL